MELHLVTFTKFPKKQNHNLHLRVTKQFLKTSNTKKNHHFEIYSFQTDTEYHQIPYILYWNKRF